MLVTTSLLKHTYPILFRMEDTLIVCSVFHMCCSPKVSVVFPSSMCQVFHTQAHWTSIVEAIIMQTEKYGRKCLLFTKIPPLPSTSKSLQLAIFNMDGSALDFCSFAVKNTFITMCSSTDKWRSLWVMWHEQLWLWIPHYMYIQTHQEAKSWSLFPPMHSCVFHIRTREINFTFT